MDVINLHTEHQMNATSQSSGFAHCFISSESICLPHTCQELGTDGSHHYVQCTLFGSY